MDTAPKQKREISYKFKKKSQQLYRYKKALEDSNKKFLCRWAPRLDPSYRHKKNTNFLCIYDTKKVEQLYR